MSTTNLGLEKIILEDTINGTMLQKLNSNMQKIDDKYGVLKNGLLTHTSKGTLEEAIGSIKTWFDTADANATSGDVLSGKVAYGSVGRVVGTLRKRQTINVTLDSSANATYAGYINGYGAGVDHNGRLVIWAMSNTTSYEHINFVNTSIGIGAIGSGWNITSHDTSDPASVPHACTITGVGNYDVINVILKPTAVNSSYDYVTVQVTVTGS